MELVLEQMPIVIQSLNVGFLQTLKLFFVTLIGAGNSADDSAFDYLLFSRTGIT